MPRDDNSEAMIPGRERCLRHRPGIRSQRRYDAVPQVQARITQAFVGATRTRKPINARDYETDKLSISPFPAFGASRRRAPAVRLRPDQPLFLQLPGGGHLPHDRRRNHGRPRPQRRIRAHRPHDLESRAAMPLCPHAHAPGRGGCRGFRPQHGLFLPKRGTCGQLYQVPLPAHRRGCLRAAKPDFRHAGQSPLFRLGIPAHPARRGDAARRSVLPAVAAAVHGYLRREPLYPYTATNSTSRFMARP